MAILKLENGSVELDDEGYLKDFGHWSLEAARALAKRDGIELTEDHLNVIQMIRAYYQKHGVAPMLTLVSKECDKSYKELHALFQKQPGKRAAKLAGLPKTSGCT